MNMTISITPMMLEQLLSSGIVIAMLIALAVIVIHFIGD